MGKLIALAAILVASMIAFVIVWAWPKPAPVVATPAPARGAGAGRDHAVRLRDRREPARMPRSRSTANRSARTLTSAQFTRDGQVHEVAIARTGFRPLTHEFAADRDLNLQLNLAPEPPPPPPVPRPPTARHRRGRARPDRARAAKKAKAAPKVEAKAEPKPPEPAKPDPATQKRGVDTDIYATPTSKRTARHERPRQIRNH